MDPTCSLTRSVYLDRPCGPSLHSLRRCCRQPGSSVHRRAADASDLLKEADDLIALVARGEAPPPPRRPPQAAAMQGAGAGAQQQQLRLHCDVSGCTVVPVSPAEPSSKGPLGSFVGTSGQEAAAPRGGVPKDWQSSEGPGWKLGYDRAERGPGEYCALVGGEAWSIALTQPEFDDFVKLLHNLRQSVATLSVCGEWAGNGNGSGSGAEATDAMLEMSTERVWAQGRAPRQRLTRLQELWNRGNRDALKAAFSMRFIILSPGQREVEGTWSAEAVAGVLSLLDTDETLRARVAQPLSLRHTPSALEEAYA